MAYKTSTGLYCPETTQTQQSEQVQTPTGSTGQTAPYVPSTETQPKEESGDPGGDDPDRCFNVCIDPEDRTAKPTHRETGEISERIAHHARPVTVRELARLLTPPHSRTVCPSYFGYFECEYRENAQWNYDYYGFSRKEYSNKDRFEDCKCNCEHFKSCNLYRVKDSNKITFYGDGNLRRINFAWSGQTAFFRDFDGDLVLDEFLSRSARLGITPAFVYETFSSINQNKFRAVWIMDHTVRVKRERDLITLSFETIFPESDMAAGAPANMYHGGKGLLQSDYSQLLTTETLIRASLAHIEDSYEVSNCEIARNLYMSRAGIAPAPKVLIRGGSFSATSIYTVDIAETTTPLISYVWAEKEYNNTNTVTFTQYDEHPADIDLTELGRTCALYSDWISGREMHYRESLWLTYQLSFMQGGADKITEGLNRGSYYRPDHLQRSLTDMRANRYYPARCENFCKYSSSCNHNSTILKTHAKYKGAIMTLELPDYISIEEGTRSLKTAFQIALTEPLGTLTAIRADTGLGKTETYLDIDSGLVCVPTHELKEEVRARFEERGKTVKVTPALPDLGEDNNTYIRGLHAVGAHRLATAHIGRLAKDGNELAQKYLDNLHSALEHRGITITTHDRLFFIKEIKQDTIIIDEDPFTKVLQSGFCTIESLYELTRALQGHDRETMQYILDDVHERPANMLGMSSKFFTSKMYRLENIVTGTMISCDVLGFLMSDYWIKEENGSIRYITRRELPRDKRIIMMSATVNSMIWKRLHYDTKFVDTGEIKPTGKLVQYTSNSFSRYQLEHGASHLELAQALTDGAPVITFKRYKDKFNTVATFGALEGLDHLAGKDLHVVGTPHLNPSVYFLYSATLNYAEHFDLELSSMRVQDVTYNGKRFQFNTYSDRPLLQNLQLYLIETHLLQAIGRARHLRNDCTITLFSNLPVTGAEYRQLTGAEKRTILKKWRERTA